MKIWPRVFSASARRRRAILLAAAAVSAPFVLLELAMPSGGLLALIGCAWCAGMLMAALLQREGHPLGCAGGMLLVCAVWLATSLVKIQLTGGSESPYVALLFAFAPCVALLVPELPGLALVGAVLSTVAGTLVRVSERRSAVDVASWAILASMVAGMAVYAAALARAQAERELRLERERRQALEALSTAERAGLETRQLAEAGRLAAAIAHDVNGPLSAARSNLSCLLEDPALPEDDRRDALRETREAVQRIIDIVGQVEAVMWRFEDLRSKTPSPADGAAGDEVTEERPAARC